MLSRTRIVVLMLAGLLAVSALTSPADAASGQAGDLATLAAEPTAGVAVDSAGNVFFSDVATNEVDELSGQSGVVTVIAGNGHSGASTSGPALASALDAPEGVAVNSAGDVLFADSSNHQVDEVTPSGTLSVVAGTGAVGTPSPGSATASPLRYPSGVAVDSAGNVYIADPDNRVVMKVTPAGVLSIVAGDGTQGIPTSPGPATSAALSLPNGVAVDSSGDLYISDSAAALVYRVTPTGTLSIFAGESSGTTTVGATGTPQPGPATSTDLYGPLGVAVDQYGEVLIADDAYVEKVTPAGILSIVAGGGTQAVTTPGPATQANIRHTHGVASDNTGNVYLAQFSDLTDGSLDEVFGASSLDPTSASVSCAATDAVGNGTQCTATVTDTASSGATPPTGTVTFSSTPADGSFSVGSCTLTAAGTGPSASCMTDFTPQQPGSYTVAASYSGDGSHQSGTGGSSAITAFIAPVPIGPSPTTGGPNNHPGTVAQPRAASVMVSSRSASVASVQISCTGSAACNLTLTISVVEKLQGGKLVAITALARPTKPKKTVFRKVVVGSVKVTVAAGKRRTVTIGLNATGRRLRARHRLKTKLTVTQKGFATHTATFTFIPKPIKRKAK